MKTSCFVIALLASTLVGVQAQVPGTGVTTADNQTPLPAPTPYSIVQRAANNRVWERIIYERAPDGRAVPKKQQYTELATGMYYDSNGQWAESKDEIDTYPQGAIARQGQYQVIFANNLNSAGAIDQQTPDGKRLRSNILGLAYDDSSTGKSVLIAQIQDSQGQLISSNQVLYPNAFAGVQADVRYTYKKGSFEQDVILRQQPPTPESLGLNSQSTEIQVLTEFIDPPQASVVEDAVPTKSLPDEDISWGAMRIGHGRAFDLGNPPGIHSHISVRRQYVAAQGRNILVEGVSISQVQPNLMNLPLQSSATAKLPALASSTLALPKAPLAQVKEKPMNLALAAPSNKGFVLDYVELYSDTNDFTFQGDTTYYISGEYNLSGTTTIEGGAVIKLNGSGQIDIDENGTIVCQTGPYRPAVFTSFNDDTVGGSIGGSSGSPSWSDVYVFFNVNATNAGVHDLRFKYCVIGLEQGNWGAIPSMLDIWNCQFKNIGVAAYGYNFELYNVLISSSSTYPNVWFEGPNLVAENVTADCPAGSGLYCFIEPDDSSATVALTNCLITGESILPWWSSGTLNANDTVCLPSPAVPVYQTVGAGGYYLATNSPYHNFGTTNIDPQLLTNLATKTTYPPIIYSNTTISVATNFSPQAQRDTSATPDLGYHYDPIDYLFGGVVAQSNFTFTAGTAFGWFALPGSSWQGHGISLGNDVVAAFNGTATSPCFFANFATVQEGNGIWTAAGGLGGITGGGSYDPSNPSQLTALFTHCSNLATGTNFRDGPDGEWLMVHATDCELYEPSGGYNLFLAFTNCLFYRGGIGEFTGNSAYSWETYREIYRNCTFYGGSINLGHSESAPYWGVSIRDCSFDGTSFDFSPPWNGSSWDWTWLDADYNATNNVTFVQEADLTALPGPNNVIPPSGFNWQSSWFGNFYLPTNSPLINAGDRTADQIGLFHFTTQTSQAIEGFSTVDIGYHYVAADQYGNPLDSNGDGIPDYLEDANGDGLWDNGETNWDLAILVQPTSQSVLQGTNVALSVTAVGFAPLNYQWYFNSGVLVNATNATLNFNVVETNNAGSYYVIVTNNFASLTSSVATLTVTIVPTLDSDYDGRNDNQEITDGTDPLNPSSVLQVKLGHWPFDITNIWAGDAGQLPLVASNVVGVISWSTNAVLIDTNIAMLTYRDVETNGNANINLRAGTIRFWFSPDWSSTNAGGIGPQSEGRLIEMGSKGSANGWWGLVVGSSGTNIYFGTKTNSSGTLTTNLTAAISWTSNVWHQIVLTYSTNSSSLYLDGQPVFTNGLGTAYWPGLAVRALGFTLGGSATGTNQARGVFDELETFNYPLGAGGIATNYQTMYQIDRNGDGMSDIWEMSYFGTLSVDPNGDPAGDGLSNLQKSQAGLNPYVDSSTVPSARLNYIYDQGGWLQTVSGVHGGSVSPDNEGNIKTVSQ